MALARGIRNQYDLDSSDLRLVDGVGELSCDELVGLSELRAQEHREQMKCWDVVSDK